MARTARVTELEAEIAIAHTALATAAGKLEAAERQLKKGFVTAMAANAASASRAEALDAEACRLRERIKWLENAPQALAPAKRGAGSPKRSPAGNPEKRSEAGGEV